MTYLIMTRPCASITPCVTVPGDLLDNQRESATRGQMPSRRGPCDRAKEKTRLYSYLRNMVQRTSPLKLQCGESKKSIHHAPNSTHFLVHRLETATGHVLQWL